MIRAAEARNIAPIVRVYSHEPALLLKVLELGAEGISFQVLGMPLISERPSMPSTILRSEDEARADTPASRATTRGDPSFPSM